MQNSVIPARKKIWPVLAFSTLYFGAQVSAYEQGSLFLFLIQKNDSEAKSAGRIAVAGSIFKSEASKEANPVAEDKAKSEFETTITSLKSADKKENLEILETEIQKPVAESSFSESSFGESSFGESSFGEDPPKQSGFFFSY